MSPTNKAALYPSNQAPSLVVQETPYPTPGPNEVTIRVRAAAINPIDQKIQALGTTVLPFLQFPLIGGLDASGTIAEVGSEVAGKFRPGDRVLAFAADFTSRMGAFQHYAAIPASLVAKIPEDTSFADAAVLPACLATAALGLFRELGLEVPPPPASGSAQKKQGQVVLVTAGSSAVGSNAIQLAALAGYEVLTTASPKNFAHCTSLGAAKVFDYHSPTLASDIISALKGKRLAGTLSCQEGSNATAFEVAAAASVEGSRKVACVILFSQEGVPAGVSTAMFHANEIKDTPLAETIFGEFLPGALASGGFQYAPKPRVVGDGLGAVQAAFDIVKTGTVSCQKLVVTLEGED